MISALETCWTLAPGSADEATLTGLGILDPNPGPKPVRDVFLGEAGRLQCRVEDSKRKEERARLKLWIPRLIPQYLY
ncbi:hypothetical protein ATANTOWER_000310 [Ataeniobius toweri]|uniref:Uncharacterized protein n=1 Tax=Ataeniobius toweri TaxID=208326 RepID=A0ABU7B5E4_9TELE|nr:hypothetical protein [Ataeniobius toweri]